MMSPIGKINGVEITLLKSDPPRLLVSARGTVFTGGWKNPSLEPRVFLSPPADGIQEFDFVATAPVGMVTQALLPIAAQHTIEQIPDGLKGVRVYALTNHIESGLSPERGIPI